MTSAAAGDAIDLFGQRYKLQVDTLVVTDLLVRFDVQRSLSAKVPNDCKIEVHNLSEATRKKLQGLKNPFVSLEAGYEQGMSLLFRGDLREVWSAKHGTEWVTTITSGDGEKARKRRRVFKTFPPGTLVSQVIIECCKALRVGLGNAEKKANKAKLWNVTPAKFHTGYTLSGDALSQLDRVCRSCGLEWSIQDNQLQLLDRGKPLEEKGIVLSPETGLLESPEPEFGKKKKGMIRARTLMIPGLYPGRRVQLNSKHVSGVYRVETTHCSGEYESNNWGYDIELKVPA